MIFNLGIGAVSLQEIARCCRAKVPNTKGNFVPRRLVTDSREIEEGDLFCALRGKKDGFAFYKEAEARGACAILTDRLGDEGKAPHLLVSSVEEALMHWAWESLKGHNALRVAITGSVGKTTLKEALKAMLSTRFRVHATYGNYNNALGVPFTVLTMPKDTEIILCEMGINHPNEMEPLSYALHPQYSVITCIGHAHIGAFGSRESIAKEKMKILASATPEGYLLVPAKEPLLSMIPPNNIKRIGVLPISDDSCKRYGIPPLADDIPRAFSLGYALTMAKLLSLTQEEIQAGLSAALAKETHKSTKKLESITLIDDGYNASPESMLASLSILEKRKDGRRVAVLGDMLELGSDSEKYHRATGRYAASCADLLFFFGAYAKDLFEGARAGDRGKKIQILKGDAEQMGKELARHLKENDTVLFKASRGLRVEAVIEALQRNYIKKEEK